MSDWTPQKTIATYATSQDTQDTLMKVHKGVVDSLNGVHGLIVVDSDQEIIAHLSGALQELNVA